MFDPYTRNKCLDALMGKLLSIEIGVELLLNRSLRSVISIDSDDVYVICRFLSAIE
jgi:hypothetical protein